MISELHLSYRKEVTMWCPSCESYIDEDGYCYCYDDSIDDEEFDVALDDVYYYGDEERN